MQSPKFVEVDGIRTRYFEAGEGEPLVLLHGGQFGSTYNAYHWSLNFDALARHFHVYAVDKLGQGHTGNPRSDGDFTMEAVIAHFRAFLRAIGFQRGVLAGHSRGALPVARVAVDEPGLVRKLVIFDSNTLPPDDPGTPRDFYQRLESPPAQSWDEYVRREPVANSYSADHVTEDFVREMVGIMELPKTVDCRKQFQAALVEGFFASIQRVKAETLTMVAQGRLAAPTLMLWGLNDPSAPIKLALDLMQIWAPGVPDTQLHVFNQAGHYTFREHAAAVNDLVVQFASSSS